MTLPSPKNIRPQCLTVGFDFWFLELSRVHRGLGCRKQRRRPFTWRRRFVVESPVFLQPTSPTRQTGLSTRKIAFSRTSQLPGGGSHSRLCRHRAKRNPLVPVCVCGSMMCACEWVCVRTTVCKVAFECVCKSCQHDHRLLSTATPFPNTNFFAIDRNNYQEDWHCKILLTNCKSTLEQD